MTSLFRHSVLAAFLWISLAPAFASVPTAKSLDIPQALGAQEKNKDFIANAKDGLQGISQMPDTLDRNHVIILAHVENHPERMLLFAGYTSIGVAHTQDQQPKATLAVDEWFMPIVPRDFTLDELKAAAKKLDARLKATQIPKRVWWPSQARVIRAQELARAHLLLEMKQGLLSSLIASAEQAQKPDLTHGSPILLGSTSDSKTHAVISWGIHVDAFLDVLSELLPETKDPTREVSAKEVYFQAPMQVILQLTPGGTAPPTGGPTPKQP